MRRRSTGPVEFGKSLLNPRPAQWAGHAPLAAAAEIGQRLTSESSHAIPAGVACARARTSSNRETRIIGNSHVFVVYGRREFCAVNGRPAGGSARRADCPVRASARCDVPIMRKADGMKRTDAELSLPDRSGKGRTHAGQADVLQRGFRRCSDSKFFPQGMTAESWCCADRGDGPRPSGQSQVKGIPVCPASTSARGESPGGRWFAPSYRSVPRPGSGARGEKLDYLLLLARWPGAGASGCLIASSSISKTSVALGLMSGPLRVIGKLRRNDELPTFSYRHELQGFLGPAGDQAGRPGRWPACRGGRNYRIPYRQ